MIKVNSFNFTPIHEFVPRKQQNKFGGNDGKEDGFISGYGNERFIALKGADNNGVTNIAYGSELDLAQDKALSNWSGLSQTSSPSSNVGNANTNTALPQPGQTQFSPEQI
jgi:hypothetical protein